MNDFTFTQQGWECPKCNNIMSPSMPTCYYCRPAKYADDAPKTADGDNTCGVCGGKGQTKLYTQTSVCWKCKGTGRRDG